MHTKINQCNSLDSGSPVNSKQVKIKKSTSRHIMAKLQETKNNEKNLKTARENKTAIIRLLADFL